MTLRSHGGLELLKLFRSDIQGGCYVGHLENLEITSAPEWYDGLSGNLVRGIGEMEVQTELLNCSILTSKMATKRQPSLNDISLTIMQIEPKLDWRHLSDIEIQKCWNCSGLISEMAPKVGILKIFKPHLLPNGKSDWAKTWWDAFGQQGNSELLKTFCYDIHDGRHSSHFEDLLLTHLELMPWSVDHRPSLIHVSIRNWSHFNQNHIHDGSHGSHLESLQLLSAPKQ